MGIWRILQRDNEGLSSARNRRLRKFTWPRPRRQSRVTRNVLPVTGAQNPRPPPAQRACHSARIVEGGRIH